MHALGVKHEQTRPDRDNYVQINMQNIKPGKEHNFSKLKEEYWVNQNTPYDYGSVMHYGGDYFQKHRGLPTIVSKRGINKGNPATERFENFP